MSAFTVTRTLKGPPERVWEILTQPSHFENWLPAPVLDARTTDRFGAAGMASVTQNLGYRSNPRRAVWRRQPTSERAD